MNSDYVLIHFSDAEAVAQSIVQESQTLSDTLQRLQNASNHLLVSGLQGAFVENYQARLTDIDHNLYHLGGAIEATGRELTDVAQKFRQLNAESAATFGTLADYPYSFATIAPGAIDPRVAFYTAGIPSPPQTANNRYGFIDGFNDANTAGLIDIETSLSNSTSMGGSWLKTLTDNQDTKDAIDKIAGFAKNENVVGVGVSEFFGVVGWLTDDRRKKESTVEKVESLAAAVTSSAITYAISLNPIGATLLAINSGVQLVGHAASGLIRSQADWLSNGDPSKAQEIRDTADKFGTALSGSDPTKLLTNVLTDVFQGKGDQVGSDISKFGSDFSTTLSSGATLAEDTINGVGQQLAKNPVINEIGHEAQQTVNSIEHFFGF